jgi:hypothetical protein
MCKANISSYLLLASAVLCLGVTGCHRRGLQQPSSQVASNSIAPNVASAVLKEIHVDQKCQILEGHGGSLRMDPVICHLESVHTTRHLEEIAKDGVTRGNVVTISEQEYLLQNVMAEPVIFVVEQLVPREWEVDSDPQPTEMIGSTALFRVNARPGEIVRLPVGERRVHPVTAPTSSTGN